MKILIDARSATWYRGTGIGTYTYNLLNSMLTIDKSNNFHLFWSGEKDTNFLKDNTKLIMSSKKHKRFFENYYIPNYNSKIKADIYHVPQNGIGLGNLNESSLNMVTIHDLIPYILPHTTGKSYLKNFLKEMPNIIDNSDGIITVSEYSKRDILKFFPGFQEDRIFVTPLAANETFAPLDKEYCKKDVQQKFNFNNPFILYLGGFSLRKNVKGLVDSFNNIFNKLDKEYNLVIVGSLRDEGLKLKDYAMSLPVKNNIIFTGFVEDDYLPILYNGCNLFVYPSLYEGFGLPPLEAMSCKTAVLASNLTSIPEVVYSDEVLIDPYNNEELNEKLLSILNNESLRNTIAEKCFNKSKDFSWKKTAESTINSYTTLYNLGKKIL